MSSVLFQDGHALKVADAWEWVEGHDAGEPDELRFEVDQPPETVDEVPRFKRKKIIRKYIIEPL
jgi:hypothetical protein